jgi:hypothetical protein
MMELPDGFTGDIVSCGKFVSEVSFRDKIWFNFLRFQSF